MTDDLSVPKLVPINDNLYTVFGSIGMYPEISLTFNPLPDNLIPSEEKGKLSMTSLELRTGFDGAN